MSAVFGVLLVGVADVEFDPQTTRLLKPHGLIVAGKHKTSTLGNLGGW
jgi:hypothetical protein